MAGRAPDWSTTGTLIKKPARGWLHPDRAIAEGGVCYCVRYIGCMQIIRSMRTLRFEERTQVSREAMTRVIEASGIHPVNKKRKVPKNIVKLLGGRPIINRAGTSINLNISIENLQLTVVDTGEVIASHAMPSISFATGGEDRLIDFIGYVAKDPVYDRACHCFDCGDLSFDVITTIGQAFELRYKRFLNQPKPNPMQGQQKFGQEDDNPFGFSFDEPQGGLPGIPESQQVSSGVYDELPEGMMHQKQMPMPVNPYDNPVAAPGFGGAPARNPYDNPRGAAEANPMAFSGTGAYDNPALAGNAGFANPAAAYDNPNIFQPDSEQEPSAADMGASRAIYDNAEAREAQVHVPMPNKEETLAMYDNTENVVGKPLGEMYDNTGQSAFNMGQMAVNLPGAGGQSAALDPNSLEAQDWFHGQISREEAEGILEEDGEFLVRESTTQAGQYVLTGMENGLVKHLLLVDPEGVVRTRDQVFKSVPDLIHFHIERNLPIVSSGSSLTLGTAVVVDNSEP